jgi:hypothetical protein
MTSPRPKYEGWLYWLAFLIAIGFRFIQLGASPLTDSESQIALQALRIARGDAPLLGPQPAYILFTSVLFLVTEATNFMARFVPAIVGSALVFAPYYFRDRLKPLPALILAFLFAFDPGLVALSRQANGTILALTFLLFAWGMWRNGRAVPAGIFAGLALLSGPSLWSGLLMLGLTSVLLRGKGNPGRQVANYDLRSTGIALVATLLLAGTLFLTAPNGLSALFSSIPAYLQGWTSPSAFNPGRMLFTFLAYEVLGIFLAVLALIRGFRLGSPRVTHLGIWLGVSLLIAVFYRQPGELVWVIIPLLILAAQELSRVFDIYPDERLEIGVVAGAVVILLVYIWFNVAAIGLNPYDQFSTTVMPLFGRMVELPFGARYVVLFGASLILIICISLVAFGWSPRTARLGTTGPSPSSSGSTRLGAAWGGKWDAHPERSGTVEAGQAPIQADLLISSVKDISRFSRGHASPSL